MTWNQNLYFQLLGSMWQWGGVHPSPQMCSQGTCKRGWWAATGRWSTVCARKALFYSYYFRVQTWCRYATSPTVTVLSAIKWPGWGCWCWLWQCLNYTSVIQLARSDKTVLTWWNPLTSFELEAHIETSYKQILKPCTYYYDKDC